MASRERKPSRCRIESFPEELRAESTPFQLETDLGNRFFPKLSPFPEGEFDQDQSTQTKAPSLDKGLPKLNDMSALLNNLSMISNDLRPSRPSSFGLLPDEALAETDSAEFEKTEVNFNMKSIDDTYEFKKPFDLAPSSLPSKYLNPSTPKFTPNSSVVALDAMFDSTYGGDVTRDGNISEYFTPRGMDKAVADFNWSAVFNQTAKKNQPPKIAVQAPTGDMSGNDSFFKGALSGRSTSIGSGHDCTKTLDEKFNDFSKLSRQGSLENFNDYSKLSRQGSLGSNPFTLGDEDFGPVAEDNLALIDADEKKIEVENQFMQDDAMVNNSAHGATGFKNVFVDPSESVIMDITSKSRFFSSNSSRLGSLEEAGQNRPTSEELRPNLGLGKIISPEKGPIKLLEATLIQTFSNEEKRDLKSLILKHGVGSEDLKKFIIKLQKKSPDETVIPDTFLTSFLEVSQNYTFAMESPRKSPRMSRIPVKSPNANREHLRKNSNVIPVKSLNMERSPSKIPKNSSNANKENIALISVKSPNVSRIPMKSPNGRENGLFVKNQKKIVKPMMGIGSKIPLSNAKVAKKALSDQNMPKQRHSSPVKLPVNDNTFEVNKKNDTYEIKKTDNTFDVKKTDNTFEVKKPSVRFLPEESRSVLLTNNSGNFVPNATGLSEGYATASFMSSTSLQSHVVGGSEFPLQSNKMSVVWLPTHINNISEQTFTLRNILPREFKVTLSIVNSEEFIFKANQKQSVQIDIGPEASRQMFLQFIPLSVGEKNAALTIRISGFKNDRGKSVKSTLKLKGTGEAEFHAMAVEETMSETLMNITNLDQTRARF